MAKTRVLILVNRWYAQGGVENFIRQLITETRQQADYVVASLITEVEPIDGCDVIGPLIPSRSITGMYSSGSSIAAAMREARCDIVHIQASNGSAFWLAHLAKRAGIPKRIVHSHNAGAEISGSPVKRLVGDASARLWSRDATDLWACSSNAGEYLFGARPFRVFPNGIDIDRFTFSDEARSRVRTELGVGEDAFLLGSMGRIAYQKNPLFQLRVFAELRRLMPEAVFCMVGSGDMEAEVDSLTAELGLVGSVLRVARTDDAPGFYSAFDALLFPSVFEGLSFVGIEGQAEGLPIYGSKALPRELGITDLIRFDSLDEEPAVWARRIADDALSGRFSTEGRSAYARRLDAAGFSRGGCFRCIAQAYTEVRS